LRPQRRHLNKPASKADPRRAGPIAETIVMVHHMLDLFKLFQLM
jgi:hypothetical protein